jgi:hypothetical protein
MILGSIGFGFDRVLVRSGLGSIGFWFDRVWGDGGSACVASLNAPYVGYSLLEG